VWLLFGLIEARAIKELADAEPPFRSGPGRSPASKEA
jgi:hypothetical protein